MTVLEKVNILQKAPIFHGVRTESLARVAAVAQEIRYSAREVLYRENDAADSMFVLMEGEVALVRNGQEVKKLGPFQEVGAVALLAGDSQPESAIATQPTQALQIDQQEFYDAMAEDFNITRGILRALARSAAGGV